ncbi:uncharacterized protein ACLA_044710 [Aspergillus clavatus NRRL 1]|uniref:Phospholipase/carboxylesterase, putative n=1 Tax=Aspergillus clavatus (strain ATCC 1007 / CBS 513.65 / DSM 816 / NCTC 3887 / NRRL 1 / QM 1276 / 107) TaxID=344612 RepID=A1C8W4_ASPCL|nr:phospholipase/carboxylesterase, putative [Aspergillus clavatus NRRL 1]EAW13751.1 phospholipase/carboxylesterase, putative [Aspergillus clavatus NRRL 1]
MTGSTLPRIACFHGGGSNAAIYKFQCEQLAHLLKNEFQFVFFNGPFERGPGPGVLPVFVNYAPFKSWFTQDDQGVDRADGSGFDEARTDGIERVWRMMEDAGPGGEWVAVMGFSQGSRMAGGLLLDQQRRERLKIPKKTDIELKFGVLCMGGGAPMESDAVEDIPESPIERISLPTLHVHGLKDPFLSLGQRQLETHYDPTTATLYQVDYHHAMPWVREEVQQLAKHIRTIHKDTTSP